MSGQRAARVGLRIDVDTLRGTRRGVPALLYILGMRRIRGSFFFSVGPDNMGRHLLRLLRPAFLRKMRRTGAARLYGWDILLKGTLWPGPSIGEQGGDAIRTAAAAGHEIGLHAWDHHRWQKKAAMMSAAAITRDVVRGCDVLREITGRAPASFAAPAWWCPPTALEALENFPFQYRSDCRGERPFYPLLPAGTPSQVPQIPATLPTYDELVGAGCSAEEYNAALLQKITPGGFHVLTIHAEVEGITCAAMFEEFLELAAARDITFCPLIELLREDELECCPLEQQSLAGRDGLLSWQGTAVGC